ncbi:MAG: hypothetical protein B6I28_02820 [Fusobacteriia bacterium 4572_132]|nr:MAG: hypothetical protein B6I28_02820 [Fusobacteriia bacterium 4572_132]
MAKKEEKKKNKQKGYFLYTILLFFIFLIISISSILFLDIVGFFNITKIIPLESKIGKMPYIGKYLKYSYKLHLSEEEKVKITTSKYQEILENQKRQLELREKKLNVLITEINKKEEDIKEREKKINEKEEDIKEREKKINEKEEDTINKKENIIKFAEIYSKMDSQKAARIIEKMNTKITAEILEKMETKKIAGILESLSEGDINKTKEIIEIMTVKGEKNVEKKEK